MASATTKKTCAKCDKGAGTAMCHGCKQSFCTKHLIEHRQELSQQIDNIDQKHAVLLRDLTNKQGTHPLLARIDQWEEESITKIRAAAESARTDLQKLINTAKNNLETSVNKMAEEIRLSRESDGYTELEIKTWTNQLEEFRQMLDSPPTIKIDFKNDDPSVVRMIKINNQKSSDSSCHALELGKLSNRISHNLKTFSRERLADTFGKIKLSEDGLVATCLDGNKVYACATGISRYSSGVHYVRFRIEPKSRFYIFLGIVNSSEPMTNYILNSTSCHGWWDFDYRVVSGKAGTGNLTNTIQVGDEVDIMLDCDGRRIQLKHRRTQKTDNMPINLQLCAFPWKMIVIFKGINDCVRIL